jgi:hypothetical protein
MWNEEEADLDREVKGEWERRIYIEDHGSARLREARHATKRGDFDVQRRS